MSTGNKMTVDRNDNKVFVTEEKVIIKVGGVVPSTLNSLTDVSVNIPLNGESLAYNGTSGKWENSSAGAGDMIKVVYDPTGIEGDAFSMSNMQESTTEKVLTADERIDIQSNKTHVTSDGKSHSDVLLNNTHRLIVTGNPHDVTLAEVNGTRDHTELDNIGTKSHLVIDTHIDDGSVHFTEASINHNNILNNGSNTHSQIDTHIADTDIHFTESSINLTASQVSDFDVEVSNNSSVVLNTAKISYTDASAVALNTTHRTSDGKSHSDVVLNNTHRGMTNNPHSVTKTQVNLSNVDNTSDLDKPVSILQASAINVVEENRKLLSAGMIQAPTLTDNNDGTVNVSTEDAVVYKTSDYKGGLYKYTIAGITNQSLVDETTNYIVVDYNAGTPIYKSITDVNLINESDVVPVYTIFREGTELHTLDWDGLASGLVNKLNARMVKTRRFERQDGLTITEFGTRNLQVTVGTVWFGGNEIHLDAVNSTTDDFTFHYHVSGVWTTSTVTQWNNEQYDDGTDLVNITNNKFGVAWIYRGIEEDAHIHMVMGNEQYLTEAAAETASTIADLPEIISTNSLLIGLIVFKEGDATAIDILSPFTTQFSSSSPTDHNNLANVNLANSGVAIGHISDLAQTIAGDKTFLGNTDVEQLISWSKTTLYETATAGENVTFNDLCYLKSDGKYYKANGTAYETTAGKLMIANETIATGNTGRFIRQGEVTTTGLTTGVLYFVGNTDGLYTDTTPTSGNQARAIGVALSTTVLDFDPSKDTYEVA